MAEKMLKIVQGGRESFIPDNQRNRQFWTKQNSKVAGSHNAQEEYVTILQATAEEVAELERQNAAAVSPKVIAPSPEKIAALSQITALEQQVAEMREMLAKLSQPKEPSASDDQQKEKAKPGPKPKTDKDGESETKDTAKA
jgi:DNA-binding ferritin-like protein